MSHTFYPIFSIFHSSFHSVPLSIHSCSLFPIHSRTRQGSSISFSWILAPFSPSFESSFTIFTLDQVIFCEEQKSDLLSNDGNDMRHMNIGSKRIKIPKHRQQNQRRTKMMEEREKGQRVNISPFSQLIDISFLISPVITLTSPFNLVSCQKTTIAK